MLDAGAPRPIASFRSERTPISLGLLVDVSGSMDIATKLTKARGAIEQLMAWLEPGRDEVALYAFDSTFHELQPFTTAPDQVIARLRSLEPFGTTSIYDAAAEAARRVVARGTARRAVVVISDGLDTGSRLGVGEVTSVASAIDVPIYAVVVLSPLDHPGAPTAVGTAAGVAAPGPLQVLARATGGELFAVSAPAHASVAARQIVSELRHYYLLSFEPGSTPGWHPLTVRVRDKALVVQARSGYIAGSPHPNS